MGLLPGLSSSKTIQEGISGSFPRYLTNVDGTLYFSATDGTSGYELWKSNGTAAGTVMVKDIRAGESFVNFPQSDQRGWHAVLRANDGTCGYELWKSDGTAAGDSHCQGHPTGIIGSNSSSFTAVNDKLYFTADSGAGRRVWVSDGNRCRNVQRLHWYSRGIDRRILRSSGVCRNERPVWTSDGTVGGTQLLAVSSAVFDSNSQFFTIGDKSLRTRLPIVSAQNSSVSTRTLSLSNASVAEHLSIGNTVGTFATATPVQATHLLTRW